VTHPVDLDRLLEQWGFAPHDGSPDLWLCLTHGDPSPKWGLTTGIRRKHEETRARWGAAHSRWMWSLPGQTLALGGVG
jgi:hypothetical protein